MKRQSTSIRLHIPGTPLLGCLVVFLLSGVDTSPTRADPVSNPPIRVVSDDNYPPYIFRNETGALVGIIPEQWALWARTTGIAVDLRAMDWSHAQSAMLAGEADVIDTLFFSAERTQHYAFAAPYANIDVPVFVRKTLTHISDAASIRAYTVGIKSGDAVRDHLLARGIHSHREYPSYTAIVLAAKAGEIDVFSIDKPPAYFLLDKFDVKKDFRQAFILYSGQFHRAVRKGDEALLAQIETGFAAIPTGALKAIDRNWLQSSLDPADVLWHWRHGFFALGGLIFLLLLISILLHIQARKHRSALDTSKRLLEENHALIQQFMLHSPICNYVREITGEDDCFVLASENFSDYIGRPGSALIGKSVRETFPEDLVETILTDDRATLQEQRVVRSEHHIGDRSFTVTQYPITIGGRALLAGFVIDITDRVRMETLRQETENRYRVLTENMRDVVWILDADTLTYLYLSPSFSKLTGFSPEEHLGAGIRASLQATQADAYEKHIRSMAQDFREERITTETFFVTELRYPRKDGTHVTTEVVAHFWKNPTTGRLEVHGATRNIEERKRGELELRESRRKHAALLSRLPGMAYRCRLDGPRTMEFVSSGCKAVTGYSVGELVGNAKIAYQDLIKPEMRAALGEKWKAALDGHRRFEEEYLIQSKAGDWRWVWERAEVIDGPGKQPIAIEGFISDISPRRKAEAESERFMRAIEQSGEAIVITDAEAKIVYVNPAFSKISGYAKEDVLGRTPAVVKSGRQPVEFYAGMWRTLLAGKPWSGVLENRAKDGTLYTESATISPAFDADGNVVSYMAVKRDMGRQLADQKEKEDLQAQLMQAQKLESVGRLAGGVAHDFNNMLQAIIGYTELALIQAEGNDELSADLQEIKKAALRSTHLTRQLLTFARKQPPSLKQTPINTVIEGMLNMLRRMTGETITLDWLPGEPLDPVMIDGGQLEQVLFNLCINARDAMKAPGAIRIRTRNTLFARDDPGRPGAIAPNRPCVEISVEDEGSGIPDDVRERIFEPFFTTKAQGEGTGLGLSVVYGIVTQAGGAIKLDSTIGRGTTVRIILPSAVAPDRANPENGTTPDAPPKNTSGVALGILVVDDELLILRPTRHLLESLGHRVHAASSGAEAIAWMREHADSVDLILSDVMMPKMSGPEMLRELLVIKPTLKYIFMSGHTANLIEKQGLDQSADNFIGKPFSRQQLDAVVRKAMGI